ncbi:MAG: TAXI family TRAP transporter solute-binding subunit [Pseudomonadota bacterium]
MRTPYRRTLLAGAFAALLCFLGLSPSAHSDAQSPSYIAIGTGGPSGVYFVAGNGVCRMVNIGAAEGRNSGRKHGLRCSAPSTGGSTYNIRQVARGDLQFALAQSDWQHHAHRGSRPDRVPAFAGLRSVMSLHGEPFHVVVGANANIRTWSDLKGKRVNLGNPGSGHRATMQELMTESNWTLESFGEVFELTSSQQSRALCAGRIDAFVFSVGVPNAGVAAATDGCGARILSLDQPATHRLIESAPYYALATIPRGTYRTTQQDIVTFGVLATLITSADVPNDIVYEVTRSVFDNLDDFRRLHPAFANLTPTRMVTDGLTAPIHPGAIQFYREQGWR